MSYTSIAFALFVAAALILYYLLPKRFRYLLLLLFSYAFYLITCGKYVAYILVTTVTTYFAGRKIDSIGEAQKDYLRAHKGELEKEEKKRIKEKAKSSQRLVMILALVLNFGILAVLKYADFCIANLNLLRLSLFGDTRFTGFLELALPLGISFYTFQSMGYIIDLYFGKYRAERSFAKLALYVSFFPQIIQGPISRYDQLSATLYEGTDFDGEGFARGLYRILWGLFKKLVVADRVAAYVEGAVGRYSDLRGTYLLLAIFLYSMQIYADFSGGIDITIGVSRLFGVKVTDNFDRPFFSKSVAEYWRRWHITLGTWFKDYIFYPITVSKGVLELGKRARKLFGEALGKRVPIYLAMFVVWFTTGLWHGAEWRYIVWGLLNFVILAFSTEAEPLYEKLNALLHWEGSFIQKCFRVFRTFWIMSFLRVFDLASGGVKQALVIVYRSLTDWCTLSMETIAELGLDEKELKAALVGILVMFVFSLLERRRSVTDRLLTMPLALRWSLTTAFAVCVLIFGSYGMGYAARDFIYLQF